MSTARHATVSTPIGPFTVIATGDPATVLASGWTADIGGLLALVAPALRPTELQPVEHIDGITDAVQRYHAGELSAVTGIAVRQASGQFLVHTWELLRTVGPGRSVTYSELAALAGRPSAVRAAASACARNAAALFVPCHRVLRTGGALGGFRWGLPAKRWLIDHELPPVVA